MALHGDEGFEFFNGARIRFLARTASSGRGFSGTCSSSTSA
ncbi:hypothetical protein O1L44_29935 [Streptomyces noursei]|nr:hypothetical protein [Streptomyces noursei]